MKNSMKIIVEYDVEIDGECKDPERKLLEHLFVAGTPVKEDFAIIANSIEIKKDYEQLQAEIDKHRWMPTDDPPDNIDWHKKVLVLECGSEIPTVMTMAEIFLDEGSEAEYWMPIPKQTDPDSEGQKGNDYGS